MITVAIGLSITAAVGFTIAAAIGLAVTAALSLTFAVEVSALNQIPVMNPCKDVSKRKGLKH